MYVHVGAIIIIASSYVTSKFRKTELLSPDRAFWEIFMTKPISVIIISYNYYGTWHNSIKFISLELINQRIQYYYYVEIGLLSGPCYIICALGYSQHNFI